MKEENVDDNIPDFKKGSPVATKKTGGTYPSRSKMVVVTERLLMRERTA